MNDDGNKMKSCLTFIRGPLGLFCISDSGTGLSHNSRKMHYVQANDSFISLEKLV